jgi:hypothetical protein
VIAASARQRKADPTELLMEVSEQVEDAYRGECNEDSVKTSDFACRHLDIAPGTLTPADVKFLREYFKCSKFPERDEEGSLVKLIEGADALQKSTLLREAAAGNMSNLGRGELYQLAQEMRQGPLLKKDQLEAMATFIKRASKASDSEGILAKLNEVIENHVSLLDITDFYPRGELLKLRVQGVTSDELQELLRILNSLAKLGEVQSYAQRAIEASPHAKVVESFISRYCARRFGT